MTTVPNRLCKMKTEKQTLDLAMQVTGYANGQFQRSGGAAQLVYTAAQWKKIEESEYRQLFVRVLLPSQGKKGGGFWWKNEIEFCFIFNLRCENYL